MLKDRVAIKNLIDQVEEKDIETLYNVILRFVDYDYPEEDEITAFQQARTDNGKYTMDEVFD